MSKLILILATLLVSRGLWAEELALKLSKDALKTVAGTPISGSAVSSVGQDCSYTLAGAAVRKKRVLMPVYDIYVVSLFVTDSDKFVADLTGSQALDSLEQMSCVAMNMHMKFSVSSQTIQDGFIDSLEANGHDVELPHFTAFIDAVLAAGSMSANRQVQVIGEKRADGEYITFQTSGQAPTAVKGPKGFVKAIFSMWLGEPTDKWLEKTREGLILNNQ